MDLGEGEVEEEDEGDRLVIPGYSVRLHVIAWTCGGLA